MTIKLCAIIPKHWSAMMGGSQLQVKYLFDALKTDKRFDLYYITREKDVSYKPDKYRIVDIPTQKLFGKNSLFYEGFSLYKLLKKLQPDVIYQRVGCIYTGVAAYYAKKNNCPMVWHVAHDSDVLPPGQCRKIHFPINLLDKFFLTYGLKKCSHIIVQTHRQAKLLGKYYHKKAYSIIHNFHPYSSETPDKGQKIDIVWIANFKKWKQPEVFIKLAKKIAEKKINAHCFMIGKPSHDKIWQKKLESKIQTIPRLSYLGELSLDQANSLLAKSDIYVNTSIAEGFANSAIQSWLRKVPVVSLHCSFDDVLEKEQIGFHNAGNFKDLVAKVELLIKNKDLRQAMGQQALNYAQKNHSQRNIEKLRSLFLNN